MSLHEYLFIAAMVFIAAASIGTLANIVVNSFRGSWEGEIIGGSLLVLCLIAKALGH